MTEVVGMFILQDMNLPAKEIYFPLLFAKIDGHVVVELPQARSCSGGVGSIGAAHAKWWMRGGWRHTTIHSGGWSIAKCGGHGGCSGGAPVVGRDAFDIVGGDGASLRRNGVCGKGVNYLGAAHAKWWLRSVVGRDPTIN